MRSGLLLGAIGLLSACAAAECPRGAPAQPSRPSARPNSVAVSTPAADVERTTAALTYAECERVRRDDPLGDVPPDMWIWPKPCGEILGSLGDGVRMASRAFAFAGAGDTFISCFGGCDVIALASGHVVEHVAAVWPAESGFGAFPIEQTTAIAALFRRRAAPAPEGRFPYARDLVVSWGIVDDGAELWISLADRASGFERLVKRFPETTPQSKTPIVLRRVWVSSRGDVLAIHVGTSQGGTGDEIGLINLHAEAAALYADLAAAGDRHAASRARAARARQKRTARALP
jgi:hypothetical protein